MTTETSDYQVMRELSSLSNQIRSGREYAKLTKLPGYFLAEVSRLETTRRDIQSGRLTPCHGEAHSNAFIDNCYTCAPRWGWLENW